MKSNTESNLLHPLETLNIYLVRASKLQYDWLQKGIKIICHDTYHIANVLGLSHSNAEKDQSPAGSKLSFFSSNTMILHEFASMLWNVRYSKDIKCMFYVHVCVDVIYTVRKSKQILPHQ